MKKNRKPEIAVVFGNRLRSWRRRRNCAIRMVADELKVSRQTVYEWERGVRFPCYRHLVAIAEYTQIPLCAFFTLDCFLCHDCD